MFTDVYSVRNRRGFRHPCMGRSPISAHPQGDICLQAVVHPERTTKDEGRAELALAKVLPLSVLYCANARVMVVRLRLAGHVLPILTVEDKHAQRWVRTIRHGADEYA